MLLPTDEHPLLPESHLDANETNKSNNNSLCDNNSLFDCSDLTCEEDRCSVSSGLPSSLTSSDCDHVASWLPAAFTDETQSEILSLVTMARVHLPKRARSAPYRSRDSSEERSDGEVRGLRKDGVGYSDDSAVCLLSAEDNIV